jgi:hypothetical protein
MVFGDLKPASVRHCNIEQHHVRTGFSNGRGDLCATAEHANFHSSLRSRIPRHERVALTSVA